MQKRLSVLLLLAWISMASMGAWACAGHFYLDSSKLGFFGGAVARMAGLTPPAPVFELEYPPMLKATIGERSSFSFGYSRPFFSKNVSLELQASRNVALSHKRILLKEREDVIEIPFELNGAGFDSISLTVRGEHRGEEVVQRLQIYVRAQSESSEPNLQVSGR